MSTERAAPLRSAFAVLLITLGCLLAAATVLAVWARAEITNTDRYVETVAPLAGKPEVQQALTDRITTEITSRLDVKQLVEQAIAALTEAGLSDRATGLLDGLAAPLASGVNGFVHDKVTTVVASPQFAQIWTESNRAAHGLMVELMTGKGARGVTVADGSVTVDLAPAVETVKQRLVADGLTVAQRIPEVHTEFTVLHSPELAKAQRWFDLLNRLGTVLPWVCLGCLAAGVLVAPRRRKALIGVGLGVAAAMALLAAALGIGREIYLDRVAERGLSVPAAGEVFDTLIRFVRTGLRTIFVLGLVLAAGAFLTGPSATAVRVRESSKRTIGRLGDRLDRDGSGSRFGSWLDAHRTALRIALCAAAVLTFVFIDRPTGKTALAIALALLFALGLLELLARPSGRPLDRSAERPAT